MVFGVATKGGKLSNKPKAMRLNYVAGLWESETSQSKLWFGNEPNPVWGNTMGTWGSKDFLVYRGGPDLGTGAKYGER